MLIQQFGSDLQFQQSHRPSVKEINAANLQVIFSHNQIYLLYKSIKIRLSNIFLLVKHTSSIDILKWKILPAEYRPSFSAFNTIVKILNLYILLLLDSHLNGLREWLRFDLKASERSQSIHSDSYTFEQSKKYVNIGELFVHKTRQDKGMHAKQ